MNKFDVAVIQTGGTISSTGQISVSPDKIVASKIEETTKEIFASFGLTCQIFYPFAPKIYDSSNISPKEWQVLKEQICKLQERGVKKFLILHGTDTMCYTASALSLTLGSCTVVLTGSQRTLDDDEFDGFDNVRLSVKFLARGKKVQHGVYIAFADEVIPAPFCHKQNASGLKAFCDTRESNRGTKFDFFCGDMDLSKACLDNVEIIRLNPISKPCLKAVKDGTDFVLVFGFGSGNVPNSFKKNLKQEFKNIPNDKKPVVIAASTCEVGLKNSFLYETGLTGLSKEGFAVFSQGEFSEEFIITILAMNRQIDVLPVLSFISKKC